MPELPEVETLRRRLLPSLLGATVRSHWIDRHAGHAVSLRGIDGVRIGGLERRGKYLLFALDGGRTLVAHLGMSGRLVASPGRLVVPHVRARLLFDGGGELAFIDRRRFGRLVIAAGGRYARVSGLATLGPEPLTAAFDLKEFSSRLQRLGPNVKARLLGQRLVAGLGNIYVDEALHAARIHPSRRSLSNPEAARLHRAIRDLLRRAIKHGGTTFSLHADGLRFEGTFGSHLSVYGRVGEPCPRCRTLILGERLGGRATHFCPTCQPSSEGSPSA